MAPTVLSHQPPLESAGKPEVLFVGADYCPFCAAERWPLIVALARFGHFTTLHNMQSAQLSVFPGIQTFSFVGTAYSSPYLTFSGVELYSDSIDADGRLHPDRHPHRLAGGGHGPLRPRVPAPGVGPAPSPSSTSTTGW